MPNWRLYQSNGRPRCSLIEIQAQDATCLRWKQPGPISDLSWQNKIFTRYVYRLIFHVSCNIITLTLLCIPNIHPMYYLLSKISFFLPTTRTGCKLSRDSVSIVLYIYIFFVLSLLLHVKVILLFLNITIGYEVIFTCKRRWQLDNCHDKDNAAAVSKNINMIHSVYNFVNGILMITLVSCLWYLTNMLMLILDIENYISA